MNSNTYSEMPYVHTYIHADVHTYMHARAYSICKCMLELMRNPQSIYTRMRCMNGQSPHLHSFYASFITSNYAFLTVVARPPYNHFNKTCMYVCSMNFKLKERLASLKQFSFACNSRRDIVALQRVFTLPCSFSLLYLAPLLYPLYSIQTYSPRMPTSCACASV